MVELWQHQKDCVEKLKDRDFGGLFMGIGTGKTLTAITLLRHKYNTLHAVLPTLIVAPVVVLSKWRKELLANSKIPPERVVVLDGSQKKRVQTFQRAKEKYAGFFIAVTNYEAMQMKDLFTELQAWLPGGVLIPDEIHRVKNASALRSRKLAILADLTAFRYGLTGTPVLNSPMDLFGIFRVLDKGQTFGRNFFAFRAQFFYDKNAGMPKQKYFPNWVPRPDTQERLGKMLQACTFQAKKEECLTLPPLVRERVEVALSVEQFRAYEEMRKAFITFVGSEACTAELAITKTLRMRQILAGFVRTEDMRDISFKANPRADALKGLLEDLLESEKVIIWADFEENYRQIAHICDGLGVKYTYLTGLQSKAEKDANVQAFETDPEMRIIIANPAAGGEGVDLIAASAAIYYTRGYSLGHREQSSGRNHRGGSERHQKITQYDIVAPGTLDEVILNALDRKGAVAEEILAWARKTL